MDYCLLFSVLICQMVPLSCCFVVTSVVWSGSLHDTGSLHLGRLWNGSLPSTMGICREYKACDLIGSASKLMLPNS